MSQVHTVKPCPKYHTCIRCKTEFYISPLNPRSAAKMAGNLPTEFGLLPWTNDQYELQFEEFPKIFPSNMSSSGIKWKIVYPETRLGSVPKAKYELERTVTSFIRYYADKGGYSSVFWLGADNIGVTLHYMHQLAIDCKIRLKKNESPRSIKHIVTDVFNYIESECTLSGREQDRVLVIYSCADHYEEKDTLREIEPFVPEGDYPRIDFMILTLKPDNFDRLESSEKELCRLKTTEAAKQVEACSEKTSTMYSQLLKNAKDSEKEDIEKVLLLVSLLYPNNMTHAFIVAAIEYIAGKAEEEVLEKQELEEEVQEEEVQKEEVQEEEVLGEEELEEELLTEEKESGWEEDTTTSFKAASGYPESSGSNPAFGMLNALDALIKAFVLRRIGYIGSMEVLCIDRRFQDDFRTKAEKAKLKETVENLHSFIGGALPDSSNGNQLPNLFKRYKDKHDGFMGSEAAMHMCWLQTYSAKGILGSMSKTLLEKVIEYANSFFVGKIAIFHRRDPLGIGNHKVFLGYTYDTNEGRIEIGVKKFLGGDRKKIKREIEKLAKLDDNHVVGYKGVEYTSEYTYLALEKCDESLEQWVKGRGPRDLSKDLKELALRFKLLRDVTEGLKYIGEKGVVHRDIKPSNILVKREGDTYTAKIADFDLSKFLDPKGSASASGKMRGTNVYRSPEVYRGNKTYHESDMYSFGNVCYFVLSGTHPTTTQNQNIHFDFDFYGVAETLRKLLSSNRKDRITAKALLEYPMFWIVEVENEEKFPQFIDKLKKEQDDRLKNLVLNWRTKIENAHSSRNTKPAMDYLEFVKRPKFKKEQNVHDYVIVFRNTYQHPEPKWTPLHTNDLAFLYYNETSKKANSWVLFKTFFQPIPNLFFNIWLLARDASHQIPDSVLKSWK